MYRNTILKPVACDLKQLPLGAVEAFVLSQIDGRLTLEEVATISGLEFGETSHIAEHLLELGAVEPSDDARPRRVSLRASRRAAKEPPAGRSVRPAAQKSLRPAAPQKSLRPGAAHKSSRPAAMEKTSRPAAAEKSTRPAAIERSARPSAPQKSIRPSAPLSSGRPATAHSSARPNTTHSSARPSITPSSARPAIAHSSARPSGRAERRSSSSSVSARSVRVRTAAPVDDVTCELDDATRARILAMAAKLEANDHYEVLDVGRDADKKAIKRAYFGLAATFHPDRFFGKKLGPVRVPLERIFDRLTVAHDTLTRREERAAYDATLPPARARSTPPAAKPSLRPSSSKALALVPRKSSRKMRAVTAPAEGEPPPPPAALPPAAASARALPPRRIFPPAPAPPPPPPKPPSPDEALRRLYASAKQGEAQRRIEIFLSAADEAMKKGDVVTAANNYRLALQNTEDPAVRTKLEAIEGLAKSRHYDQSLNRARAAEKAERWGDAATYFAKANSARPEAPLAERAAFALRMSGGDLHRAAELAQQAIALDPKNAGYRVTLGEIYLEAKLFTRAAGEAARALEIAPHDRRAKELVASLPKKK
jgi:DnaJ domain/Tetratricopeptide repeat